MDKKKYDAVIAGYTCVDLFPGFNKDDTYKDISDLFVPGKLIEIGGMDFVLGGIVPNTGLAMKKFGKQVYLNGLIGNDFIGEIARARLDRYGVSEGIKATDKVGTAYSIVIAPPGIDRIFLESPGCNWVFDSSHIDYGAAEQSRLFHFGYPPLMKRFFSDSGRELVRMFSKIKSMGVATSLDFSLPDPGSESGKIDWSEIMEKTLPHVDIFVPSLEELLMTMMPMEYEKIQSLPCNSEFIDRVPMELIRKVGRMVIGMGVKILLIKVGSRGAYLITGDTTPLERGECLSLGGGQWKDREVWCNAYRADSSRVVNACGAGDTAAAAFLSALLDGESPERAVKYATIAGRDNLYCEDIYNDMGNWQDLSAEIDSEPNELIYF